MLLEFGYVVNTTRDIGACIQVSPTINAKSDQFLLWNWCIHSLFSRQSKSIAITCMAFPKNDINNFVLGSEDGCVYSGCRHSTRPGIGEAYEKHLGPVTGISTHYNQSSPDFGHLFLTSSIDWTIKLWSLKVSENCDELWLQKTRY